MKRLLSAFAAVALLGSVAACDTLNKVTAVANQPVDAQDLRGKVLALERLYLATLKVAKAYTDLDRCELPNPKTICSRQAVVYQIRLADNVAYISINAAEQAARSLGSDATVGEATYTAAKAALNAFTTVSATQPGR
jgi:hypothetical protein